MLSHTGKVLWVMLTAEADAAEYENFKLSQSHGKSPLTDKLDILQNKYNSIWDALPLFIFTLCTDL